MNDPSESARVRLTGSDRPVPPDAVRTGEPDPSERTTVTIVVRSNAPAIADAARLAAVMPAQRTYVTRAEFAAQHGASPSDVLMVQRFALASNAIVLETSLARRSVVIEGTLEALAAAFGAELHLYERGGEIFRGRVGSLFVPASLDGIIVGVFGLDERPQARAQFRRAIRPAAASAVSYSALQVAQAYGFPSGFDGAGQTIALIELGGGYAQADLDAYFAAANVPSPVVTSVSVDGGQNAPVGDPNSADSEVLLDVEIAGAIAPAAKIVVYFAPNTDQGFLDAITTAIHDSANAPQIVSISWGGPESSFTAQALQNFDAAFADAGMLGVTVFCAAGDNGSTDGQSDGKQHVDFPASSPHVLGCGGTSLELNGAAIAGETVWNDGASGGASGGGVSDVFALPVWQSGANVPPGQGSPSGARRGVPDIAGDADPQTGYVIRVDGTSGVVGGTSAVAPLWAGLFARINQAAGKPVGFVNAQLYANPAAFRDIVAGNNGAYAAGKGWDACTGLGSPDGAKLAALFGAPAPAPGG